MKIFKGAKMNRGMSYVELIVVLSIFAIMSSVAIYNYGDFQANVDIKNLASDIALQIVTAQKSSLNGVLPASGAPFPTWKPSYGVYFNTSTAVDSGNPVPTPFNKEFVYFADLSNPPNGYNGLEALNYINITKNNSILSIQRCSIEPCGAGNTVDSLTVLFKRPDSGAIFYPLLTGSFTYYQINITSPKLKTAFIRVYPSGRVQAR